MLIATGAAFTAIASLLAPERAWIEAVSEAFVPYGAVPLAVGFAAQRPRVLPVALLGAGATIAMVLAFYFARPIFDPPSTILWEPLLYWCVIGGISGALLAVSAWWLRPRMRAHDAVLALGTWLLLALLPFIFLVSTGWGRIAVDTSSGIVEIGYGTADVIVAIVVLAAFSGGVILAAMREPPRRTDPTAPAVS